MLGAKSMMLDFGEDVAQCVLGTDSSSAKSIMERRGAGRIRHLHCPMLWLQERVDSGEVRTEKRKGEHNTADIGTKAVSAPELRKHLRTLKMEWRDGRHPLALSAAMSRLERGWESCEFNEVAVVSSRDIEERNSMSPSDEEPNLIFLL